MEVIAGVASVAGVVGILGLVGKAVHGILKLKDLVHGVSTASETVKSFLEAIDSLEGALTAISDLLQRAPEEWLVGTEAQNTNRLTLQVGKCQADINERVKEMPKHHANSSKDTISFLRKLRVASDESAYSKIHQKVARHLQGMQMILDVLGCSYNTHVLKQANVIAEDVKDIAEAQTSFNHEVMQRFPESNESRIPDLSPVFSQLDRMENSSQMSRASILASNVSRILELVSSNPALAVAAESDDEKMESGVGHASSAGSAIVKTKLDLPELLQRPSRTQLEWCCDFLPGIEAAFSASGSTCLYCGNEFDQASAEWSFKGKHLVDEHRYGECNLLLSYDSEERFAQHVQEFHQCSLGYTGHEFLIKHGQIGRGRGFHRGIKGKGQNLTDDFHSIRNRRWEALFDNNRSLKSIHEHYGSAKAIAPPESAQGIEPVQRPWEVDLNIALLEEDCIIDDLMVASNIRPCLCANHHSDDRKKPRYSMVDGIKVYRNEFNDRCRSLFEATRLLDRHDTNRKPGLGGAKLLGNSWAASVLPNAPLDAAGVTKERSQINSWFREILKNSSTARVIMFHAMRMFHAMLHHDVSFSDMYTWLEKVLEFWELDEAATKADELDNSSDGAVDSRGSPEIQDAPDHEISKQLGMPHGGDSTMLPRHPTTNNSTNGKRLSHHHQLNQRLKPRMPVQKAHEFPFPIHPKNR